MNVLGFIIWLILSCIFPLGFLGDIIYRKMTDVDLGKEWYTYIISIIPLLGPIISYFILESN